MVAAQKRLRNGLFGRKPDPPPVKLRYVVDIDNVHNISQYAQGGGSGFSLPTLAPKTILLCVAALVVVLPTACIQIDLDLTRILFLQLK